MAKLQGSRKAHDVWRFIYESGTSGWICPPLLAELFAILDEVKPLLPNTKRQALRVAARHSCDSAALCDHEIDLHTLLEVWKREPDLDSINIMGEVYSGRLGGHDTRGFFFSNGVKAFAITYCDPCGKYTLEYRPDSFSEGIYGANGQEDYNALDCPDCFLTYWRQQQKDAESIYGDLIAEHDLVKYVEELSRLKLDSALLRPFHWDGCCEHGKLRA